MSSTADAKIVHYPSEFLGNHRPSTALPQSHGPFPWLIGGPTSERPNTAPNPNYKTKNITDLYDVPPVRGKAHVRDFQHSNPFLHQVPPRRCGKKMVPPPKHEHVFRPSLGRPSEKTFDGAAGLSSKDVNVSEHRQRHIVKHPPSGERELVQHIKRRNEPRTNPITQTEDRFVVDDKPMRNTHLYETSANEFKGYPPKQGYQKRYSNTTGRIFGEDGYEPRRPSLRRTITNNDSYMNGDHDDVIRYEHSGGISVDTARAQKMQDKQNYEAALKETHQRQLQEYQRARDLMRTKRR